MNGFNRFMDEVRDWAQGIFVSLGFIIVGVVVYVSLFGPGLVAVWYGIEYKVPTDKIIIERQPTDCDF